MNMNIMSMNMNIGLMNMNGRYEHSCEYELYELFYFWVIYVLPVPPTRPYTNKNWTILPYPPTPQYWQITCYSFLQLFSLNLFVDTSHDFWKWTFLHGSRTMAHREGKKYNSIVAFREKMVEIALLSSLLTLIVLSIFFQTLEVFALLVCINISNIITRSL